MEGIENRFVTLLRKVDSHRLFIMVPFNCPVSMGVGVRFSQMRRLDSNYPVTSPSFGKHGIDVIKLRYVGHKY